MPQAEVRVIRIMRAIKEKTAEGEITWTPTGNGYMSNDLSASVMIESERPDGKGPFRIQLYDDQGQLLHELSESHDSPPEVEGDWRAELAYLFLLAGRANPRQERVLDQLARELGLTEL